MSCIDKPVHNRHKKLPSTVSMKHRMSEENFWAFWCKNNIKIYPDRPFSQGICLAREGENGLIDIQKGESGTCVMAICLRDLKVVVNNLNVLPISHKSVLPSWLSGKEKFLVLSSEKDVFSLKDLFADMVEAHSNEEAIMIIQQSYPKRVFASASTATSLQKIVNKMQKIYDEEDYAAIFFDRRPVDDNDGFPTDWLDYMQYPYTHTKAKEVEQCFKDHPEKYKEAYERDKDHGEKFKGSSDPVWRNEDLRLAKLDKDGE